MQEPHQQFHKQNQPNKTKKLVTFSTNYHHTQKKPTSTNKNRVNKPQPKQKPNFKPKKQ